MRKQTGRRILVRFLQLPALVTWPTYEPITYLIRDSSPKRSFSKKLSCRLHRNVVTSFCLVI